MKSRNRGATMMATCATLGLSLGICAGNALAAQGDQAGLTTTNKLSRQIKLPTQERQSTQIKQIHQDKTSNQDKHSKQIKGENFGKKVEPKEESQKK